MKLNRWLGLAALAASVQILPAADITGKVTLNGKAPAEKDIPLDPSCGPLHANGLKTRLYVVGAGGELADTFIYLKDGVTGATLPVPAASVLDQKGCEYSPYVSGLMVGQTLNVRNSDPMLHNVHYVPSPDGKNKEKNQAQLPGSKDLAFTFTDPEPMAKFKCDVHPWMFAYVNIVPHPYFAVSAKDGTFTIKNVPKGEYTVEAIHRKAGSKSQKVTVGDGNATANFTLDLPAAQ